MVHPTIKALFFDAVESCMKRIETWYHVWLLLIGACIILIIASRTLLTVSPELYKVSGLIGVELDVDIILLDALLEFVHLASYALNKLTMGHFKKIGQHVIKLLSIEQVKQFISDLVICRTEKRTFVAELNLAIRTWFGDRICIFCREMQPTIFGPPVKYLTAGLYAGTCIPSVLIHSPGNNCELQLKLGNSFSDEVCVISRIGTLLLIPVVIFILISAFYTGKVIKFLRALINKPGDFLSKIIPAGGIPRQIKHPL